MVTPPADWPATAADPEGTALCQHVLPAMTQLAHRLELARHDVRIDDRTDRHPPSVRFQVLPWAGPLEPRDRGAQPVLELVEAAETGELIARTWLDPGAEVHDAEDRVPLGSVERRLRRMLLDFVERSLAG